MLFQYTTSQHNYYAHGAVDIHVWYHTRDITHNASFLCLSMLCNIMSILCGIISYTVRTVSHAMMDNGHDICDITTGWYHLSLCDMDDDNVISNVTYHSCMICPNWVLILYYDANGNAHEWYHPCDITHDLLTIPIMVTCSIDMIMGYMICIVTTISISYTC